MARLIKILKKLQDNLGEYQDLHVHIDQFKALHQQMSDADEMSKSLNKAITKALDQLNDRQLTCRSHFQQRFEDFKPFGV